MTTAPARLNGHAVDTPARAAATPRVRLAEFPLTRPVTITTAPEPVEQHAHAEPSTQAVDPVALAEAEAIRLRAAAEAEERRIKAEAEAEATRLKARAEDEKQRLANERAAKRQEREDEEHALRVAKIRRAREEEERQATADRERAEAERRAAAVNAAKVDESAKSWRRWAIGFAIVCAVVALPVQMDAFWNPREPWLIAAPAVLEGLAWVIHRGARAAVDEHRPHWHYRLIIWAAAFIAAGINLVHGLNQFDAATAIGTAFASLAGPGVWDLHEHGRIRTRDGKLTRAQAKARRAEEKRIAAEKDAAEAKRAAEKKAEDDRRTQEKVVAEQAAAEAAEQLAKQREEFYPQEWERAVRLAAAVGETTVSEATWKRACFDVNGAAPGEDANVVSARNAAVARMQKYVTQGAENGTETHAKSQVVSQMPSGRRTGPKGGPTVRGIRRAGDTPRYVNAARTQAAITAKNAANNASKEGN